MRPAGSPLDAARRVFASFVAARDAIRVDDVEIVDRDELHTPPYHCFAAIGPGPYLRGLARADGEVLTYEQPDAFGHWLRGVRFGGAPQGGGPSAVQLVQIHRLLTPPSESSHPEGSFPLLFPQQLATAPTAGAGEPLALPWLDDTDGGVRRAHAWWQLEPGSRFELRTYSVAPGGMWSVERHAAQEPPTRERPG